MSNRDISTSDLSAIDLHNVSGWSDLLDGSSTSPRLTIEMRDGSSRVTHTDTETNDFLQAMDAYLGANLI